MKAQEWLEIASLHTKRLLLPVQLFFTTLIIRTLLPDVMQKALVTNTDAILSKSLGSAPQAMMCL